MKKEYLFVDELVFVSDRLRHIFEWNADVATDISFKEIQQLQKQIQSWNREFVKPPISLVAACDLEKLIDFYRNKLNFSIFHRFGRGDFKIIQNELAAYAAREALDALIGYRLRNWAAIGLRHPKWRVYQKLVHAYYERTLSQEKRNLIAGFEKTLDEMTDRTLEEIHAICVGELFFEVDRIRLMSMLALNRHLENIRLWEAEKKPSSKWAGQALNVPESLRNSFQIFGFTHQVDFGILKDRYRQLALDYHPDKGGSLEMMQKLNVAYRQIVDYLRQNKG